MAKFRIMPHGRLQEWVADEKGYFAAEGLDYEFVHWTLGRREVAPTAPLIPDTVLGGALEDMQGGRACEVSSACHWCVNMAAASSPGRMWGGAIRSARGVRTGTTSSCMTRTRTTRFLCS